MKKLLGAVGIMLVLVMVLTGCAGKDPAQTAAPSKSDTAGADAPGQTGDGRTDIVIGMAGEPVSVEPQSAYDAAGSKVVCNVYDGLVDVDDDNNIIANLAKDWDISDDGLVYTFHLRDDIRFHNGDPLTAEDFVYSIEKAIELGYGEETTGVIDHVEATGEHTLDVTLKHPYKPMMQNFAHSKYLYVVNSKLAKEAGDNFAINPVGAGTGPYKFVSWTSGVNVKLEANEDYHRGAPAIKEATFKFIPEQSSGAIALETGDVDVYTDLSFVDVPNLMEKDDIQVDVTLGRYAYYLCMNQTKEMFQDIRVRQALAYSINMDEFILAVLNGIGGTKTGNVVFPDTFGYAEGYPPFEQNVEEAKRLLAEAGYPDGISFTILATDGLRKVSAETLQGMMAKSGIDVKIDLLDFSAMVDKQVTDQHDVIIMNSSAPIEDADSELTDKIMSGKWGNFSRYANPVVDDLMVQARMELDDAKRADLYAQIQEILRTELPIVPMYYAHVASGANANLKGFRAWGSTYIFLRGMSW